MMCIIYKGIHLMLLEETASFYGIRHYEIQMESIELKLSKALSVSAISLGILGIVLFSIFWFFIWGYMCFFWIIISIILVLAGIFDYYRADKQEKRNIQQKKQDRYCPNCGRGIPFDAKRCPYCSKDFEED